MNKPLFVALMLVLTGSTAALQTQSPPTGKRLTTLDQIPEDQNLVEMCPKLPAAGAERVAVAVMDNNLVLLLGLKGRSIIWQKRFPLHEEVNKAKAVVVCDGPNIEVSFQMPFSAFTVTQTFSWDGQKLTYLKENKSDSSAEAIEEAIKAAERGDARKLKAEELDILYPGHYIGGAMLADAIARGRKAALKLYQAKQPREAAARLALMLDLTVGLCSQVNPQDDKAGKKQNRLAGWLKAWKACEVEPKDYAPGLTDYGFFLQEAGDHKAAVPIFEAAIKASPQYVVAYLNLADSLWALGRQAEAKERYRTYQRLMAAENKRERIPPRVTEQLQ